MRNAFFEVHTNSAVNTVYDSCKKKKKKATMYDALLLCSKLLLGIRLILILLNMHSGLVKKGMTFFLGEVTKSISKLFVQESFLICECEGCCRASRMVRKTTRRCRNSG